MGAHSLQSGCIPKAHPRSQLPGVPGVPTEVAIPPTPTRLRHWRLAARAPAWRCKGRDPGGHRSRPPSAEQWNSGTEFLESSLQCFRIDGWIRPDYRRNSRSIQTQGHGKARGWVENDATGHGGLCVQLSTIRYAGKISPAVIPARRSSTCADCAGCPAVAGETNERSVAESGRHEGPACPAASD